MFLADVVQMTLAHREVMLCVTHGLAIATVFAALFLETLPAANSGDPEQIAD